MPRACSRFRCWAGRKFIIENNEVGGVLLPQAGNFLDFAAADKKGGVGAIPLLRQSAHDLGPSGFGQLGQFLEGVGKIPATLTLDTDKQGVLVFGEAGCFASVFENPVDLSDQVVHIHRDKIGEGQRADSLDLKGFGGGEAGNKTETDLGDDTVVDAECRHQIKPHFLEGSQIQVAELAVAGGMGVDAANAAEASGGTPPGGLGKVDGAGVADGDGGDLAASGDVNRELAI